MRRLRLAEYAKRAFDPLPRDTARALARTGAVGVSTDIDARTVLVANSRVGVLHAGGVELRITPKLPIARLLWLIGHAHDPSGWRDEDNVGLGEADDLVSALAVAFSAAARRALRHGVLQDYRTTEAALPLLRGRIRHGDQLRTRLNLATRLEVVYDDYTIDIGENQILRAAAERLLRIPGLPPATYRGLRQTATALADVTALAPGDVVPRTVPNRRNSRYQPSLRLARIVLAGRGVDHTAGTVPASGFLFDLPRVFEDWLGVMLRAALAEKAGRLRCQSPVYLDLGRDIAMRPDFVWEHRGQPAGVIDAKYKQASGAASNADVYQMLAYCTALGLREGHLVYAAGKAHAHEVRGSGIRIHIWTLDLTSPPSVLRARVGEIAESVARGVSTA